MAGALTPGPGGIRIQILGDRCMQAWLHLRVVTEEGQT